MPLGRHGAGLTASQARLYTRQRGLSVARHERRSLPPVARGTAVLVDGFVLMSASRVDATTVTVGGKRCRVGSLLHRERRLLAAHAIPARGGLDAWAVVERGRLCALPAAVVLKLRSRGIVIASRAVARLVLSAVDPARELRCERLLSVHSLMCLGWLQSIVLLGLSSRKQWRVILNCGTVWTTRRQLSLTAHRVLQLTGLPARVRRLLDQRDTHLCCSSERLRRCT